MTDSLQSALSSFLSNPQSGELLKKLLSSQQEKEAEITAVSEENVSEKEKELETKINILKQLKPLFSADTSAKIDTLINALNIAKIISASTTK